MVVKIIKNLIKKSYEMKSSTFFVSFRLFYLMIKIPKACGLRVVCLAALASPLGSGEGWSPRPVATS